jgi:Primase C terminal 1 (PriCT-1)
MAAMKAALDANDQARVTELAKQNLRAGTDRAVKERAAHRFRLCKLRTRCAGNVLKPITMIKPQNIPSELIALPQWVLWRSQVRDRKPTKVPHTAQGYRANVTNPDHWSTFDHALKAAARPGFADGVGFVFSAEDSYCGIDLDKLWLSDADQGAGWGTRILQRFSDTYGEASPSDTGYKIWCKAKASRCSRWPIGSGQIEIYDHSRFFTLTSRSNGVIVIADHQADVEALVSNLDQDRQRCKSRVIPAAIPQGQRHHTLVSLAGTLWKRGVTAEAVEAALLAVNRRQCDPPYGPEHIQQIIKSLGKWSRI